MSPTENHLSKQSAEGGTTGPEVGNQGLDESLHRLWRQYGRSILIGCMAVVVALLAKGGWDYLAAQKEQAIRQDYAAASTSDNLRAFAEAHSSHILAGVARLRLADEAYAAGKGAEAVAAYEVAVPKLKNSPLAGRAQLGLAMAKVLAGRTTDGEVALLQIADQADAFKGQRAEALYHLASLAHTAGRTEDVNKYAGQLMQIDAGGAWAQRAQMLRLETAMAASAPVTSPDSTSTAEPAIKLNLPTGK